MAKVRSTSLSNGSKLYLRSNDIQVYPSSRRSDYFDRNAKMNSEQNLISAVNRLTGKDSFVISGLEIEYNADTGKYFLKTGTCNIHGYLFKLNTDIDISSIKPENTASENYLCFSITIVKNTKRLSSELTATYDELGIIDLNFASPDINATELSLLDNNSSEFNGLLLCAINKATVDLGPNLGVNNDTYYLPLAEWKDNSWVNTIANDGFNTHRWNLHKYRSEDITIKAEPIATANEYYDQVQDLSTWLQNNFILDDGSIE